MPSYHVVEHDQPPLVRGRQPSQQSRSGLVRGLRRRDAQQPGCGCLVGGEDRLRGPEARRRRRLLGPGAHRVRRARGLQRILLHARSERRWRALWSKSTKPSGELSNSPAPGRSSCMSVANACCAAIMSPTWNLRPTKHGMAALWSHPGFPLLRRGHRIPALPHRPGIPLPRAGRVPVDAPCTRILPISAALPRWDSTCAMLQPLA
jgi:hypothetical protein